MSFENLHKNKKLAFLDGFLTGAMLTAFVVAIKYFDQKDELETHKRTSELELMRKTSDAYHAGYEDGDRFGDPIHHYAHCRDLNCVHRTIKNTK